MKILYIAHSGGLQGAGIALLNIVKGGAKLGITPIVVLPNKGEMYNKLQEMGVSAYVFPYRMDVYPSKQTLRDIVLYLPKLVYWLILRIWVEYRIALIVKKEKVSIIHTNTSVIHWGSKVAKKLSIPHVWHIRECQDVGLNYHPIGGMCKLILAMGSPHNNCVAITKAVFEHHCLNINKDCVIYDGVFSEASVNQQIDICKDNYLLYVGVLSKHKGVLEIIDAFSSIVRKHPNTELWLAGVDCDNIADYVETLQCRDKIKLLGFRKDVYTLMQHAKAIIVASYFEGFGFVTAEAMINGCLVIGRNTGGTKEQFDVGVQQVKNEIALRFNNQDELAMQMDYACNINNEILHNILESAKSVAARYTIENNTEALCNLYKLLTYEN